MMRTVSRKAIRTAPLSMWVIRGVIEVILLLLSLAGGISQRASAQTSTNPKIATTERILVRPHTRASLLTTHHLLGARVLHKFPSVGNLEIVEVPAGKAASVIAAYKQSGLVEYAEPDQTVHALLEPNDFEFVNGDLWHLKNNGQMSGVFDADIDATDAWNTITSASNVVVAILDSGIRATHEDLAPNLWRNPKEIAGNGVDDDGNGYIDDVNGINTLVQNGNPDDDYGHGSHVAGIIGAAGNNGVGVAGICWRVQLMPCKFLNSHGIGSVSDAIICINYARTNGAKIINLSWGDPAFASQALYDAIDSARAAGVIVVCACGNSSANNDATPLYPASYPLDNIISVAATTRSDSLANFSSYGQTTVHLGAPGESIVSTWMGANNNYTYFSGTSMAAPMVAGACALLWAKYPGESYHQIINRVVQNVDPLPALTGKCISGGRLNVAKALGAPAALAPLTISSISVHSTTNIVLTWSSQPGKTYVVQTKTNLESETWLDLSEVIMASGLNTFWTNQIRVEEQRFYKLKQTN